MSDFQRIGLIFSMQDALALSHKDLDLVLIPGGIPLAEENVAKIVGCPARNLNRYTAPGAMTQVSRRLAPIIRSFMGSIQQMPVEALASQNDIYQYHLRLQFYFLVALEAALKAHRKTRLVIVTRSYPRYWSPMRPEIGKLHHPARVYALLAGRLARELGVETEIPAVRPFGLSLIELYGSLITRRILLGGFRWLQLIKKCINASRDPYSRKNLSDARRLQESIPVGIVVRTDSEVISASALCRELTARGVSFLLIHDEMLSSQTTRLRLLEYGLPYVTIGASRGLLGLLKSWAKRPRHLVRSKVSIGVSDAAEKILAADDIWEEMTLRLLDFAPDQHHFAAELSDFIVQFNLRLLVTYAYIDQWGPVILEAGKKHGLKTVAVQNAAQDPEEYPRLNWSHHYCVESTWLKRKLVGMGYPENKITATGLPQFAGDFSQETSSTEYRSHWKTIAVLTQPIYEVYFDAIIRTAAEVAQEFGMRLLVKYHPRQNISDYADAISAARQRCEVITIQRESLDSAINQATVVISVVSAALIRAIFLGVPTFSQLPIEERHLDLGYVSHPVTKTAESASELRDTLVNFLNNFDQGLSEYRIERRNYLAEHAVFEPSEDVYKNVADVVLRSMRSADG